jgi:hypothetical protein
MFTHRGAKSKKRNKLQTMMTMLFNNSKHSSNSSIPDNEVNRSGGCSIQCSAWRETPCPSCVASSSSFHTSTDASSIVSSPSTTAPSSPCSSTHSRRRGCKEDATSLPASPSAVCQQRSMSTVLITSWSNAIHFQPYVRGRPAQVCASRDVSPSRDSSDPSNHRDPDAPPALTRLSSSSESLCSHLDMHDSPPPGKSTTTWTHNPLPLRREAWKEAAASEYFVRGPTYLQDSVKVLSEDSIFQLWAVDLVKVTHHASHMNADMDPHSKRPKWKGLCALPHERIQQALQHEQATGRKQLPSFVFAVNLVIPGDSSSSNSDEHFSYHWVAYFGLEDDHCIRAGTTPWGRLAQQFFFGNDATDDDFRDSTFKLIPRIVQGNFWVRQAVGGSKPTLLGHKLKQSYVRTDRYCEAIVDVGSEPIARRIVQLSLGYAKTLTIDLMFLLQGNDAACLPERMLGGVRMHQLDFAQHDGQRVCEPSE